MWTLLSSLLLIVLKVHLILSKNCWVFLIRNISTFYLEEYLFRIYFPLYSCREKGCTEGLAYISVPQSTATACIQKFENESPVIIFIVLDTTISLLPQLECVTCQSGRATVEVHIIIWNWITEISVLKVIKSDDTLRTLGTVQTSWLGSRDVLLGANVIRILKPGSDPVILCASKERFTSHARVQLWHSNSPLISTLIWKPVKHVYHWWGCLLLFYRLYMKVRDCHRTNHGNINSMYLFATLHNVQQSHKL